MNLKKLIVFVFLFPSLIVLAQTEQEVHPNYDEIVTIFFNKYSIKDIPNGTSIQFEKRPTGWYIALISFVDKKHTLKSELF